MTSKIRGMMALSALCALIALFAVSPVMAAPGYTPVRNVDDAITNPYAVEVAWFSGTSGGFTETSTYTVPSNKRFEIEEISCEAYAPSSTQVMMKITFTSGGNTMTHYIMGFSSSLIYGNYWILGMTSHHLIVDPGSNVTIDVVRQTPAGTSTGYYSDVILSGRMTTL
jgi:hypothetical protein